MIQECYLRVMALGEKVDPPMPITALGNSRNSPEGNWVGYMNWGLQVFYYFFSCQVYFLGSFTIISINIIIPVCFLQ